jgi:DNA polymerase elongation subunit (family B)
MQSSNGPTHPKRIKGLILDVYPSDFGEVTVWIIGEKGERVRLTDKFQPKMYISGKEEDIERLASRFFSIKAIASFKFEYKYAHATDAKKSKVLEVTLKDCRKTFAFTRSVLKMGDFLRYEVHNCDLHGDQAYLFSKEIFPLALVEVNVENTGLKYTLLDSVEGVDYSMPPLRIMKLSIEIARKGRVANLNDPIKKMQITQADSQVFIDSGEEKEKLLQLVKAVKEFDPDIVLTAGGDSHIFPYLIRRAMINDVLDEFILSRDDVSFLSKRIRGRTYFSYGRTYYRPPTNRLFGRIHIDEHNTFILNECGFEGLIEIARTCRVPLHKAARSSIGSSMSALQFYQAIKNDVLIPRKKSIPEAFKSAYELLVGDRGGFIYEPKVGIHDLVGEVDFASMYPSLMIRNNISAETVLCECCPNSQLKIPELNYHICEKRVGIVPKALRLALAKRLRYKQLREETTDPELKEVYDRRQAALKWILVTCFGYLGYRNAKFGTVDGHMGVCAFGRDTFLKAVRISEQRGFTIVHGIVDSLWLKKEGATIQEYVGLCQELSQEIGVQLNFEGRYKWIIFLPSKIHPRIGVLNRYYGIMENGTVKVRGLEVRRRDTPRFVYDAQREMIEVLSSANNSKEFFEKIPDALEIVKVYRQKLLDGEIPIWNLVVSKRLSKNPKRYKQRVSQVIAAEQLIKRGAQIHAGENIRFLFTSAENKRHERRVIAEQLIEPNTSSDIKKYLLLLYSAASNLLSFSGYTTKTIYDMSNGLEANCPCLKLASRA